MFDACCCIDVDEGPDLHRETHPVARKKHKCCECNRAISPGEKYRNESCLYERSYWSTFRTCMTCARVRDDRMSCGFYYGRLWEDLAECYRGADDDGCTSLAWLHEMFDDEDCECAECYPQTTEPEPGPKPILTTGNSMPSRKIECRTCPDCDGCVTCGCECVPEPEGGE